MDREFSFREEALAFHREGKRALPSPPFGGFRVTLAAVVMLAGLLVVTLAMPVNACEPTGRVGSFAQTVDLLHFLWSPSSIAGTACP